MPKLLPTGKQGPAELLGAIAGVSFSVWFQSMHVSEGTRKIWLTAVGPLTLLVTYIISGMQRVGVLAYQGTALWLMKFILKRAEADPKSSSTLLAGLRGAYEEMQLKQQLDLLNANESKQKKKKDRTQAVALNGLCP